MSIKLQPTVSVLLALFSIVGCLCAVAEHPPVAVPFADPSLAQDRQSTSRLVDKLSTQYRAAIGDTGRSAQPDSITLGATGRKLIIRQRRLQQFFPWLSPQGSTYQPYSGWQAEPSSYIGAEPAAAQRGYWGNWRWFTPRNVQPASVDVPRSAVAADPPTTTDGPLTTASEAPVAAPLVRQQHSQTTQANAQQTQKQTPRVTKTQEQPASTADQQVAAVQQPEKPNATAQAAVRQTNRRNRNANPRKAAAATDPQVSIATAEPPAPSSSAKPAQSCISATRGMQFNILAAGDSITQGSVPSRNFNHPYTLKLNELLRRRLGKNADAVTAGLGGGGIFMEGFNNPTRFPPFYLGYLNQVEWNVAVIGIGINDLLRGGYSATDIMAGLQPLYDQTLAKGVPVIAIPPFAAPGFVSQSDPKEGQRKMLASLIVEAAGRRQIATGGQGPQIYSLDLQAGPLDFWKMSDEERSRYLDDGLHMTEYAYDMIGQYVYETVNALFCSVENPTVTLPAPNKP